MRGKSIPALGGGPGNEHNYTSGLLLYYYLTGDERAREAVIALVDWVVNMDDGRLHWLAIVSKDPTGLASSTREPDFHGPGRGAGNSINALVDGWLLTQRTVYRDKCHELIRRVVSPADDPSDQQLADAERRWSYTVCLHALAKYLAVVPSSPQTMHRYVRDALLRYARWMSSHERFYLDGPEELEYPTETWAAQELRKATTLKIAASLIDRSKEVRRFRTQAAWLSDRAWNTLISAETRSCTRPLAIVLQQGYIATCFEEDPPVHVDMPDDPSPEGTCGPTFLSQRQEIRRLLRSPAGVVQLVARGLRPDGWRIAFRQSWTAELARRSLRRLSNTAQKSL
jgi:hypothetical protein